jgi:hypothetical protein
VPHRYQSGLEIKVQYLAPSDGYYVGSSLSLDPAQSRVHEQAGDGEPAVFRNDGQESYFVQTVIERERENIASEVFVDGIMVTGRRDAHKTSNTPIDCGFDIYVEGIERIRELLFGVGMMLPEFESIDLMPETVNCGTIIGASEGNVDLWGNPGWRGFRTESGTGHCTEL